MMKHVLVLTFGLMVSVQGAAAQAPPTATTPPPPTATVPVPKATAAADCAPAKPDSPHSDAAPGGTTTGQAREPLGDRLAQSGGVLCPPSGVDPEIRAPTPNTGNTPVIPPPGSPGGNQNVQPK